MKQTSSNFVGYRLIVECRSGTTFGKIARHRWDPNLLIHDDSTLCKSWTGLSRNIKGPNLSEPKFQLLGQGQREKVVTSSQRARDSLKDSEHGVSTSKGRNSDPRL